jgi:signal transduction histidine kinase
LPRRTEPGYWIEKNFTIKDGAGRVTQLASISVEVTRQRQLEQGFRKLCGELLWRKEEYQRLARELHVSVDEYHAALGTSLDRLSRSVRDPENLPALLAQSLDFLDEPMRKLTSVVARCFPMEQH